MSFYHDRHTILVSPQQPTIEDELAGRKPMSQLQAILAQLGAEGICAMSPQAKGRIERMWQTLQDRLRKEMRLAGITTIDAANDFLACFIQRYNRRFAQAPANQEPAWVRSEDPLDLPYFFASKQHRTVRDDHTLTCSGSTLLIQRKRGERSVAGERIQVHTTPEGDQFLYRGKQRLDYCVVDQRPHKTQPLQHKPKEPTKPDKAARKSQMYYLHQNAGACRR